MKSSFFLGNKKFEIRQVDIPAVDNNQVLVKNMAAGICGTDVHIFEGDRGSAVVTPPIVLGHEYAGVVSEVGRDVTDLKKGDHVAIDPNIYCGKCYACRMGKKQHCINMYAIGVNINGGFAEYSVVPASQCLKIDKNIEFDTAAMTEPLACAIHGIDQAAIKSGETVLIIGGGTIGQIMIQLARISGASRVILSEPNEMRRKIGSESGADFVIDPINENLISRIEEITNLKGVDIVIECAGNTKAVNQAIEAAGFGSTVLLFSVPNPESTVPLPLFDVYRKELKILGSFINPDTQQRAVNLINQKRIRFDKLITHSFSLDEVEKAIFCQMGSDSIKVVVHPHI